MGPLETLRAGRHRHAIGRAASVALVLVLGAVGAGCSSSSDAATATGPAVVINGASQGWTFHDGQTVTVSMGPNKVLTPYLRILILECADPGGKTSNLPSHFAEQCDGDTVQGNSVIPTSDGSFTAKDYTMYRLPSKALNEGPTWVPVCNASNPCVLYVGDDFNDFTKPKVFSKPFTVTGSGS